MSIYTKTGDRGKTSLFELDPKKRNRVSKSSLRIEAIGSIDEANSYLGIASFYTKVRKTKSFISQIQTELFQIGGILSKAPLQIHESSVQLLEKQIDEFEQSLPPLKNFLLPQGTESAVHIMYARSLVRRAERAVVALSQKEAVPLEVLKYLNRLSDYLFMVFRAENSKAKESETLWMGKKS